MSHINTKEGVPGIRALALFRPEMGKPLYEFVQTLLRGDSPLSSADRELIAAFVSSKNNTKFCMWSHAAAARYLLGADHEIVDMVLKNIESAPISDKMKALLNIAGKVQIMGDQVKESDITRAKQCNATDIEIHDTVLVASAFCMFNRYVDGLAAWTPTDMESYVEMGKRMGEKGYVLPS